MSVTLEFSSNNTKLTGTATAADKVYVIITAVTDSNVTYTEVYADGSTEVNTHDLAAGQSIYGIFKSISASTGFAKASF